MAHTVMHSFTVIFVGLAKLTRAFFILAVIALAITDLIGPEIDRTMYFISMGFIVAATIFEVGYVGAVDAIGDYLYSEK